MITREGLPSDLTDAKSATVLLSSNSPKANCYHFLNRWIIEGSAEEVDAIFSDPGSTTNWWGAAHSASEVLAAGDEDGRNRVIRFIAHGWLPYSLQYLFRVSRSEPRVGFTMEAAGDFRGTAECRYEKIDSNRVALEFSWVVEVTQPIVHRFSFLLRPLFASNHFWVMRRGREALQLEVRRRRGETSLPPFPAPVFPHSVRRGRKTVRWKRWTASWEEALRHGEK